MQKALSFNDVLIVPGFSTVKTRAAVDLTTNIGELTYKIPVMSANMDTVTGITMAQTLDKLGAAAAIHRFMRVESSVIAYRSAPGAWMSVGVGVEEERRFIALRESGCKNFVLDVAHAANDNVVQFIEKLAVEDINLIVGNFAGANDLESFLYAISPIDRLEIPKQIKAIKIGVGSGSACQTRVVTGCGLPTLHAVLEVKEMLLRLFPKNKPFQIIADGGIKNSGDAAKALAAGADMVMLGSVLAGTYETPGTTTDVDGKLVKTYRGSASFESYADQGKIAAHRVAEGVSYKVPYKGPVENVLNEFTAGLKSAFSYVGAFNLSDFHELATLREITTATYIEGTPFGSNK